MCNTNSKGKIHDTLGVNSLCLSLTVTIARNTSIIPYMALTVIFAVLALLLFMALLVVAVYLYIRHRKRIIGKIYHAYRTCSIRLF